MFTVGSDPMHGTDSSSMKPDMKIIPELKSKPLVIPTANTTLAPKLEEKPSRLKLRDSSICIQELLYWRENSLTLLNFMLWML